MLQHIIVSKIVEKGKFGVEMMKYATCMDNWLGDHPQPDSDQAVDGMRHVGFRVFLVLFHCLCYKNDVILNDQSNI